MQHDLCEWRLVIKSASNHGKTGVQPIALPAKRPLGPVIGLPARAQLFPERLAGNRSPCISLHPTLPLSRGAFPRSARRPRRHRPLQAVATGRVAIARPRQSGRRRCRPGAPPHRARGQLATGALQLGVELNVHRDQHEPAHTGRQSVAHPVEQECEELSRGEDESNAPSIRRAMRRVAQRAQHGGGQLFHRSHRHLVRLSLSLSYTARDATEATSYSGGGNRSRSRPPDRSTVR
eukprot:scaffold67397_cov33-Tisochrysis_lutea.AAC.2